MSLAIRAAPAAGRDGHNIVQTGLETPGKRQPLPLVTHPRAVSSPGKQLFDGSHSNPTNSSCCIMDRSLSPLSLGWMRAKSHWHGPRLPEAQGVFVSANSTGMGSFLLSQTRPTATGPAGGASPDVGSAGVLVPFPCTGGDHNEHPRREGARREPCAVSLNDVLIHVN